MEIGVKDKLFWSGLYGSGSLRNETLRNPRVNGYKELMRAPIVLE